MHVCMCVRERERERERKREKVPYRAWVCVAFGRRISFTAVQLTCRVQVKLSFAKEFLHFYVIYAGSYLPALQVHSDGSNVTSIHECVVDLLPSLPPPDAEDDKSQLAPFDDSRSARTDSLHVD